MNMIYFIIFYGFALLSHMGSGDLFKLYTQEKYNWFYFLSQKQDYQNKK
jgi:hypothetical protein